MGDSEQSLPRDFFLLTKTPTSLEGGGFVFVGQAAIQQAYIAIIFI
jgi:hypothetical protein